MFLADNSDHFATDFALATATIAHHARTCADNGDAQTLLWLWQRIRS
jgi:hypothetical protein